MALTTLATIGLMAGLAAAGGQIAGGIAANKSANQTAKLQEEQAKIALDEANVAADQKAVEQRKFLAEQRMAYLANGVTLVGTPGIVQSDTFSEFQMEIDAIRKSGAAKFRLGLMEAANTKSTGRAQLLSGIFSGLGTAATAAAGASSSGLGSGYGANTPTGVKDMGTWSKLPGR